MLKSIKGFFEAHMTRSAADSVQAADRKERVAAAALLVEVVRADASVDPQEREAVLGAVQRKFSLDPAEAEELFVLAQQESHEAVDLYQFTSAINQAFSPEQKSRLIEELWRAAIADGVIHHYEEYVIRKVADLIHVPHSAFIAAKLRVTERGR